MNVIRVTLVIHKVNMLSIDIVFKLNYFPVTGTKET